MSRMCEMVGSGQCEVGQRQMHRNCRTKSLLADVTARLGRTAVKDVSDDPRWLAEVTIATRRGNECVIWRSKVTDPTLRGTR